MKFLLLHALQKWTGDEWFSLTELRSVTTPGTFTDKAIEAVCARARESR
jgi:hypothetical protein